MKEKDIKLFFHKFSDSGEFVFSQNRYMFFSPGLFLILLGVAVFLAPKFFLFIIATFFLTVGCFACFLIWKFLQFKQKFEKLSKEFKGQVVVQGIRVDGFRNQNEKNSGLQNIRTNKQTNLFEEPLAGDLSLTDITARETKKIIFH